VVLVRGSGDNEFKSCLDNQNKFSRLETKLGVNNVSLTCNTQLSGKMITGFGKDFYPSCPLQQRKAYHACYADYEGKEF